MTIPTLWHPFPDQLDIWDRVFRTEIEYPLDGMPVVKGHVERTYDVRGKKITEYTPSMELSATLQEIMTAPELSAFVDGDAIAIRPLLYTLWTRKISDAPVADL